MPRLLAHSVVALFVVLAAPAARADESARCRVRSIFARPEAGALDPALSDIKWQLEHPPFTHYKTFKLLDEHQLVMQPHTTQNFTLPDGRTGSLTFIEHLQPEHGKHRMRLKLDVQGGPTPHGLTFVLDEGGTFFDAGHKHQDGITILGVSCATSS